MKYNIPSSFFSSFIVPSSMQKNINRKRGERTSIEEKFYQREIRRFVSIHYEKTEIEDGKIQGDSSRLQNR